MRVTLLALPLVAAACVDPTVVHSEPVRACPAVDGFIAGTLERRTSEFTFNDDVPVDAAAHLDLRLNRSEGADAAAPETANESVIFVGFPGVFAICVDPTTAFDLGSSGNADGDFFLSTTIFNHAGTDLRVGDFVNTETVTLRAAQSELVIAVEGLEDCDSANAGGACATAD
jgi:hypothetical protein